MKNILEQFIKEMGSRILALLWPEVCPFCSVVHRDGICPSCRKRILQLQVRETPMYAMRKACQISGAGIVL